MKTITLSVLDGGFLIQAHDHKTGYKGNAVRVALPGAIKCIREQLAAMEDAEVKMLGVAPLDQDHSET